jgi:hypothetical protein
MWKGRGRREEGRGKRKEERGRDRFGNSKYRDYCVVIGESIRRDESKCGGFRV